MIYELRTYTLKPGSLAEVEKRFGDAYSHREKYSNLAAFWHTEIGPLNQIVHLWPYENIAERSRVREAAFKDTNWPPKLSEFITAMESDIFLPFPFAPAPAPGKPGPVYELRAYRYKAGLLPEILQRWEMKLPERLKVSPLTFAGYTDIGALNKFVHIWPYPSLDLRAAIRDEVVAKGIWPPGVGHAWITQENKILLPSKFSPLQ